MHTLSNKNDSWKPTEFTYDLGIMGYVEKGQPSDLTVMLKINQVLIQTLTDILVFQKCLGIQERATSQQLCGHSFLKAVTSWTRGC